MMSQEGWLWTRKLQEIIKNDRSQYKKMSPRIVQKHLKHLEEEKIIEYESKRKKRGSKRRFRLCSDHMWKENLSREWCRQIYQLIRDALFYLGDKSIEKQLAQYHIGSDLRLVKFQPPIRGKLTLNYDSKIYFKPKNQALSGKKYAHMELNIEWEQISSKKINLRIKVNPMMKLPITI